MIQIEELRIGNLINYNGALLTVHELHPDYIVPFKTFRSQIPPHKIKPIPLTSEILESYGFVKKEHKNVGITWDDGKLSLIQGYLPEFYLNHPHYGKSYKYLHQIQNLYFALTGHELTPSTNQNENK